MSKHRKRISLLRYKQYQQQSQHKFMALLSGKNQTLGMSFTQS